jgi:hypothetical protein
MTRLIFGTTDFNHEPTTPEITDRYFRGVWFEELKFNKHSSTFVLFDKKFLILD